MRDSDQLPLLFAIDVFTLDCYIHPFPRIYRPVYYRPDTHLHPTSCDPSHSSFDLGRTHGRNRLDPPDPPQHPPSVLRPPSHLPLHLANDLRGPGKIFTPSSRDLGAGEGTVRKRSRGREGKGGTFSERSQGVGGEVEEDHLCRCRDRNGTTRE